MQRYLKPIVAALLLVAAVPVALALNVDQNRVISARFANTQQTHYYRFTVNYNDPRISTAQKFGKLPSNSFINRFSCHVTTAFNAATTNNFYVGTSATTPNEIVDPSTTTTKRIYEASAQFQDITAITSLGLYVTSAGETDLYTRYVQTGTAATAGSVTCVLQYTPNNDM